MTTAPLLFALETQVQAESARPVLAVTGGHVLDMIDARVRDDIPSSLRHGSPRTVSRLFRLRSAVRAFGRQAGPFVLVAPQDVGLDYRAVIASAREAGAAVALLPDGVVAEGRVTTRASVGGVIDAVDWALRRSRLLAGRQGSMGSSRPDLCLSWGPGWNELWADRGAQQVLSTGCPRMDDLTLPPTGAAEPRILVLSQPLWQRHVGGEESAAAWYRWIGRLCSDAPAGRLRVRLHPAEVERLCELPVAQVVLPYASRGASLVEDLADCSVVASPFSSGLVEAMAAGRPIVTLLPSPGVAEFARRIPFLRDPRIPALLGPDELTWTRLAEAAELAERSQADLAASWISNVGSSAAKNAQALQGLAADVVAAAGAAS